VNFLVKILISSLAVLVTAWLLPGVSVDNYLIAILVAAVLAFLNSVVKPLFILFTLPVTVVTLGLFLLAINAIIILLADYIVDGFEVRSFFWALIFSLVLSIVTSIFERLDRKQSKNHSDH